MQTRAGVSQSLSLKGEGTQLDLVGEIVYEWDPPNHNRADGKKEGKKEGREERTEQQRK